MANSMALWYERWRATPSDGNPPAVEVHLNLWRHIVSGADESNFLDIGLLVSNAYEVGRICLYIPASIPESRFEDLSVRLQSDTLLSAVFNDVVKVNEHVDESCYSTSRRKSHYLMFHRAQIGDDFSLCSNATDTTPSTLLVFNEKFCQQLHKPGPHYIRLRFNLDKAAAAEFSFRKEGRGDFVLSSVQSSEFTELRFNEMRNIPPAIAALIEKPSARMFQTTAAHCFIIRDMNFELIAAHATMHKMRRMEADLWTGYLPVEVSKDLLAKMVVYHWRTNGSNAVESFITLARFRRSRETLFWYVPGIVALGAIGSGLQAWLSGSGGQGLGDGYATLLLVGLVGFMWISSWAWPWLKRICRGRNAHATASRRMTFSAAMRRIRSRGI